MNVASALETEVRSFVGSEPITTSFEQFPNLDHAFATAPDFTNVPTFFLVLPTRSKWSVLWNNSFLCNGYDSLCFCLTCNHQMTTIHWSSHDGCTTFQSGSRFVHRQSVEGKIVERSVYATQEDKRWHFHENGAPLPEEDLMAYSAHRKKDRLNEGVIAALLSRLVASPWQDDFYTLSEQPTFVLKRHGPPATVLHRARSEVLRRSE